MYANLLTPMLDLVLNNVFLNNKQNADLSSSSSLASVTALS